MSSARFLPSKKIGPFHPPQRTLMGPGPSDVPPRVLAAMSLPTIGHLDPAFVDMMDELKSLLRYAFQSNNLLTFPVSGPGSVGMEMAFVNLVEPGDKVIVCRNGVFGSRMIENVDRCGGTAVVVDDAWGTPVDPGKVEDTFRQHPDAKVLAFVHAETSTGCASDVKTLTEIAHRFGALTIVDAVTSLAGIPLLVDEWDVDAVYSGSQKCLSCTPGLSPVSFGQRVVERVKTRKRKCQSWFMDLDLVLGYWTSANRTYHHTAPINSLFALHESLVMLREEGLEESWARHRRHYAAFHSGLEAMGLEFLVAKEHRLPQLNAVRVPEGVDEAAVRRALLQEFNLEIGAGLGPLAGKIWRFGLMGHSAQSRNVMMCLSALGSVLMDMGYPVRVGQAEAAAHQTYADLHAAEARRRLSAAVA
jgi:alanine-glyoxylate transaminase/serine-glyoxylate transaminase/serine-pyruvate transaminase